MDELFLAEGVRKIWKVSSVITDNAVFRLHYKLTAAVLFIASLLVTGYQFFGNPIYCIIHEEFPAKVVDTFCWVEGTFTLPKALTSEVGLEVPHPGVAKHLPGDDVIRHLYYQWVALVLFLQATLFLIPRAFWKGWERDKIKDLLLELNKPALAYDVRHKKYDDLIRYFTERIHKHKNYFLKHFLCEILNLVNVVGQMFLIDKFLGGEFTTYGAKVFEFMMSDEEDRVDPMIRVFPKMTKCTFHHFGYSGDVQKLDTLCVLPMNILNEKIYVFLWFWFVILAGLSGVALIYRIILIFWSRGRFLLIESVNYLTNVDKLKNVMHVLDFGDWFVLYMLGNNIDNVHFRELIEEMSDKFEELQFFDDNMLPEGDDF